MHSRSIGVRDEAAPAARFVHVFATNCNALVATVVTSGELSPAAEAAVTALLNGEPVQRWVAANYQTQ